MPNDSPANLKVLCLGCRYDLSGLDASGHCPECGKDIEPAILAWRNLGPLVMHAGIVGRGLSCCSIGFITLIAGSLMVFAIEPMGVLLALGGLLLLTVGWAAIALGVRRCDTAGRGLARMALTSVSLVPCMIVAALLVGSGTVFAGELIAALLVLGAMLAYLIGMAMAFRSLHVLVGSTFTPLRGSTRLLGLAAWLYPLLLVVFLGTEIVLQTMMYGNPPSWMMDLAFVVHIAGSGLHGVMAWICVRTDRNVDGVVGGVWRQ